MEPHNGSGWTSRRRAWNSLGRSCRRSSAGRTFSTYSRSADTDHGCWAFRNAACALLALIRAFFTFKSFCCFVTASAWALKGSTISWMRMIQCPATVLRWCSRNWHFWVIACCTNPAAWLSTAPTFGSLTSRERLARHVQRKAKLPSFMPYPLVRMEL